MAEVITIILGLILPLPKEYYKLRDDGRLYNSSFSSLLIRPIEADNPNTGFYFDNIFGVFKTIKEALNWLYSKVFPRIE